MRQTQVQHTAAALSLCEQQPSAVRLRNLIDERQTKTKRCAAAHERPVIVYRGGAPPAGKQVIEPVSATAIVTKSRVSVSETVISPSSGVARSAFVSRL